MTELRVSPDSVAALGSHARQLATDLDSALRIANSEVAALATSWKGEAGTAYLHGWQELHDGGAFIFAALRALGYSAAAAAETVADRDDANATSLLNLT